MHIAIKVVGYLACAYVAALILGLAHRGSCGEPKPWVAVAAILWPVTIIVLAVLSFFIVIVELVKIAYADGCSKFPADAHVVRKHFKEEGGVE